MRHWLDLVKTLILSLFLTGAVWTLDLSRINIFFVKLHADALGRPQGDTSLTYIAMDDGSIAIDDLIKRLGSYQPQAIFKAEHIRRVPNVLYRWPAGPYPLVSAQAVWRREADSNLLQDKVLLVGESMDDASLQRRMREFDAIRKGHQMPVAPDGWVFFVSWLIAALVMATVFKTGPLRSFLVTCGISLISCTASLILFGTLWLPVGTLLVVGLMAYYLTVPFRLLLESRMRGDLQRREETHIKVEALKTHFLSLVTHDLKTPVAKIQGLAETLKIKAKERLNDRDLETIAQLLQSADDLNRFISSLLELSRVESEKLLIKMESRDINAIVEKAVAGFKALARSRGIRLVLDLEPLFPVYIDIQLVMKVLNNIIDNALKYSAAGSEVRIQSREINERVQIAITDQGMGLSEEEQHNIFRRFYRVKNEVTQKQSGTGLGLYLSRFFIQAMGGTIEVTSELGKGSTFLIDLPAFQDAKLFKPEDHAHVDATRS